MTSKKNFIKTNPTTSFEVFLKQFLIFFSFLAL
jgi:hypothetical protein